MGHGLCWGLHVGPHFQVARRMFVVSTELSVGEMAPNFTLPRTPEDKNTLNDVDTPFTNQDFAQHLNVNYPVLSDFNREAIPNYTGFYDDVAGLKMVGKRGAFVIDRSGIVRYKWITEVPHNLPDIREIITVLQDLQQEAATA